MVFPIAVRMAVAVPMILASAGAKIDCLDVIHLDHVAPHSTAMQRRMRDRRRHRHQTVAASATVAKREIGGPGPRGIRRRPRSRLLDTEIADAEFRRQDRAGEKGDGHHQGSEKSSHAPFPLAALPRTASPSRLIMNLFWRSRRKICRILPSGPIR